MSIAANYINTNGKRKVRITSIEKSIINYAQEKKYRISSNQYCENYTQRCVTLALHGTIEPLGRKLMG